MTLNNENNNECCKCTTPEIYIELNQQGPQGRQGNPGVDGVSPEITVVQNTDTSYVLKIEDANGSFTTPNLKAALPLGGVDGQMLVKLSNEDGVVGWEGNIDNLVTLDSEQTIEGEKNFTADNTSIKQSLTFTDNNLNRINTTYNGLGIYVDKNDGGDGATSNYFNMLNISQDKVTISPNDKTQNTQVVINSSANVPLVLSNPTDNFGYLHQGNVTAGENVTINKTDNGGIEISSTGGGSTELLPATDTTLGGIIIGDGLQVDDEGVTSLNLAVNKPLELAGDIPANPHIVSGEGGKGSREQDVIEFNNANGHTKNEEFEVSGNILSIKNATNGVIDWKNNILEIPTKENNNYSITAINVNTKKGSGNGSQYAAVFGTKEDNSFTPKYLVTVMVPRDSSSATSTSTYIYKINDNGTVQEDKITTNYSLTQLSKNDSEIQQWIGWTTIIQFQNYFNSSNNYLTFWIFGDRDLDDNSFQSQKVTGTENAFNLVDIGEVDGDPNLNCVYVMCNANNSALYNSDYPFLAKYTGVPTEYDTWQVPNNENIVNQMNSFEQHYIEVTQASGTPTISLNYDNTTLKVNEEGKLYADIAISDNITTQGNTFNGASQLVQLDSTGKLPALDGSQLTNLPSSNPTIQTLNSGTDFNSIRATGTYFWSGSGNIANNPNTNMRGYLQVFRYQDNTSFPVVQIYTTCDSTTSNNPQMYIRYCTNGNNGRTWTPWLEITNQSGGGGDLPGNVATLDGTNVFTAANTFSNTVTIQNEVLSSDGHSIINGGLGSGMISLGDANASLALNSNGNATLNSDTILTTGNINNNLPDNVVTTDGTNQFIQNQLRIQNILLNTNGSIQVGANATVFKYTNAANRLVLGTDAATAISQMFLNAAEVRISNGIITNQNNSHMIQKSLTTITLGDSGDSIVNGAGQAFYTEDNNAAIAELSMTSLAEHTSIILPASGETLTINQSGWLNILVKCDTVVGILTLYNSTNTKQFSGYADTIGRLINCLIPVTKGEIFNITYANSSVVRAELIHLKGEE